MVFLGFLGLALASFFCGLWWGERGRRLDAQVREGVIPVGRVKKAVVTKPVAPDAVPSSVSQELSEAKDRYVEDAVREGYSADEAALDWDLMMSSAGSADVGVMS